MKKGPSFRSLRFSRDILGVDLGSHTVKLLQLRLFVLGHASKEVGALLAEVSSEEGRRDIYVEALRHLLKTQRFRAKRGAFSLAGNASLMRFLRLIKPYKVDSKTGIPEEAKALSPFDPQDTGLEVRIIEQDENYADAMVLIAQKKAIAGALSILRKTRLRPAVVLNDPLAMENAYNFVHGRRSPEPVVLVNIGAATTSLSIIENSVTRVARTFNIAGDAFTRALKREFSVSVEEAEALKKEYGLFGHLAAASGRQPAAPNEAFRIYNETAVRVFKALDPSVSDLIGGIDHTIDTFLDKRPKGEPRISKILLSGGGAALRSLQEVLGMETGLSVEIFDPLENAVVRNGKLDLAQSASMAVVYGLALSGILRGAAATGGPNLLPLEEKRAAARRNAARVLLLASVGLGVIVGGGRLYDRHRSEVAALEAEAQLKQAAPPPSSGKRAAAPPAKPKPVSRFAFLGRLKFSGAFGDVVMFSGAGGEYVAKAGRLFDQTGKEVKDVKSRSSGGTVVLSVAGEEYVIHLPK